MLQLGFLLQRCCLLGFSSHCHPDGLLGSLNSRRRRRRRRRATPQRLLPELPTMSFSSAEGSRSPCCCLVLFSPMAPTSLLEERSYISYSFNSSTSHCARHKSNIMHMQISLLIYGPAWELHGVWILLSGFASKIGIIPPGFGLIALF